MPLFHPRDRFDKAFEVAIWFKGIHGLLETISGIGFLFLNPVAVTHWIQRLTAPELSQDPHDFFASHLLHWANGFTRGAALFAALYLLAHGVIKLVLVVSILRDKLWAYPALIAVTGGFIVYQLYHIVFVYPTASYILLTLLDGIVIYLTWGEYGKQKVLLGHKSAYDRHGQAS